MSNLQQQNSQIPATGVKGLSSFLNQDNVKAKFADILGQKANGFIASVLSAVSQNDMLKNADQSSIYLSAMMAASLDLPINQNLGFAYLVPYKSKQKDGTFKDVCQFQMGAKGYRQLALRSGQFKFLNESDVRDGEIKKHNRLTGEIEFEWIQDTKLRLSKPIVGYVSYFQLLNGFENTLYWTVEEIEAHAKKYSQTYKKYGTGLWKDDFEGMAKKTVLKMNLSKNAPLSIEMQRAVLADQAVIKNFDPTNTEETLDVETQYVDNEEVVLDHTEVNKAQERIRVEAHIEKAKTLAELEKCLPAIDDNDHDLIIKYEDKKRELTAKK